MPGALRNLRVDSVEVLKLGINFGFCDCVWLDSLEVGVSDGDQCHCHILDTKRGGILTYMNNFVVIDEESRLMTCLIFSLTSVCYDSK